MKREQLQSWNILSFNPMSTDVDEHIDLKMLCCSNVVQVPLSLNPFQLNLEFGTTHRVALCVVHPRYTKSNRIYNKSQN